MSLKPYQQYKNSDVPWIGEVPNDWTRRKLRSLLSSVSKRDRADLPLLSVVREKGVIRRNLTSDDENHNYVPDDLTNYKMVQKGQFAMNKMKAWQGSYGISKFDGIVSPAYFVFNLSGLNADFFHTAIRSKAYVPFFTQASDGIRVGQWDLNQTRMKEIPFWIPPGPEQEQITRYLDWKIAQINRFIKAKKRQIELLKEQKQVIINNAVTGKIDVRTGKPYPKYKESGLEWLGIIPEIWSLIPLKRIALSNQKTLGEKVDPEYEFDYLEINKVKAGYLADTPTHLIFKNSPSRARRIVSYGDTIISTVRTYLRSVYFIDKQNIKDLIVSTGFCVLTPKTGISAEYLGYLLRSDYFISRVIQNSVGVSYPAISDVKLMSLKVPLPTFNEQQQIVKFILSYNKNLDRMVSTIETEVKLLQEYKASLIADVVTGKLDVRDISVPEFDIENEIEGVVDGAELSEDIEEEVVANE